ncbi:MAG: exopolysaccharide biosynthesis protein [Bacteroidota bacterium]|nr:exopolysaccharide biosynthesis protein [Kiloniellaceae bacterium]
MTSLDQTAGTRRTMSRSLLMALRRQQPDASAVPLGGVLTDLGNRSFGWSILLFGLVNLIPMPIGSQMLTGLPLLLLTAQMVLGFSHVRLPGFVNRRRVSRRRFQEAVLRLRPVLRPLERVIRPRLAWLFARRSERLIGVFLFLVAIALVLPIPLSGFISAFALFITGVGLAERDGAITLLGLAIGLVALAVSTAAAITIVVGVQAAT